MKLPPWNSSGSRHLACAAPSENLLKMNEVNRDIRKKSFRDCSESGGLYA